jgi:hypothetical protein
MIFVTIIGLLVVIPLVSHIINVMHQKNAASAESGNAPIDRSVPRRSSDLIDPNTPSEFRTMTSSKGDNLVLVFSDEFKEDGRKFGKGQDPFW